MLEQIHEMIWGPVMLCLFLFVGGLYSVRIRAFQLTGIPRWWKTTIGSLFSAKKQGTEQEEGITPFQSACTALAATIGTGNIAGVATALLAGGPGAVFWMWASAFLGMATAYGETELGIRYRKRDGTGKWLSGPMLYLEAGFGRRFPGLLYAALCAAASFGMGSMVQANAISETASFVFSIPEAGVGFFLTFCVGAVLVGGAERIMKTAEKMVPVSAAIYIVAAVGVIFVYRENLPAAFAEIFRDAFAPESAVGGIAGYGVSRAVRYGVARGVFSNEAGLGSMAVLNGGADSAEPGIQGQWAIFEVFFDTIVSCTLTALAVLCVMGDELETFTGNGAALTSLCFTKGLGTPGSYAVSVCVTLFAFATVIAWYYMGRQAVMYLGEAVGKDLSYLYLSAYLTAVFLGSLGPMESVWEISDILNGLMALPNLVALILLSGKVRRPTKETSALPSAWPRP